MVPPYHDIQQIFFNKCRLWGVDCECIREKTTVLQLDHSIHHSNLVSVNSYRYVFPRDISQGIGARFNIKMSSYQRRKSHCGDKTVVRSSYLHNGTSYTGKMVSLYWISPLVSIMWYRKLFLSLQVCHIFSVCCQCNQSKSRYGHLILITCFHKTGRHSWQTYLGFLCYAGPLYTLSKWKSSLIFWRV